MEAFEILKARGVSRLCHFTKFQSLTHILASEDGILASSSIRSDTKNVTDTARYDGELDYICCSIEYPNSWFLKKAIQSNTDKLFRDWAVLYIDLDILKIKETKFSPCNASKSGGLYIDDNMKNLNFIFADRLSTFSYPRTVNMLSCCPTDGQAEILIRGNIPRSCLNGIAVGDDDVAKRIYAMLKMFDIEQINIYIAPDVLTPSWSNIIKQGRRPDENLCVWSKEE